MRVAIEGCLHGELDKVYAAIKQVEDKEGFKVDLLIVCGDFQSLRNVGDLEQMAVPDKFKQIGNFHEYYSGKKVAPILTVFVGGNHEGSNYLWELYHGGWVCPNIYFLGFANVINIGGLRIGGLTGIFDAKHYRNGFHEVVPYTRDHVRSIYHVRAYNEFRLSQITEPLDIFVSHDWPRGIYHYGNCDQLLRQKGFFEHEIRTNTLGSEVNERLLHLLKPKFWFSAHLHVKFAALVPHHEKKKGTVSTLGASESSGTAPVEVKNPDAIDISTETLPEQSEDEAKKHEEAPSEVVDNSVTTETSATNVVELAKEASGSTVKTEWILQGKLQDSTADVAPAEEAKPEPRYTKFLALDKCMPRRDFLQILEISPNSAQSQVESIATSAAAVEENSKANMGDESKDETAKEENAATPPSRPTLTVSYDEEWLAIVRATDQYMSFDRDPTVVLPVYEIAQEEVQREREWIKENLVKGDKSALLVPNNFVMTTVPHNHSHSVRNWLPLGQPVQNPQTVKFCETIGLKNKINSAFEITTYVAPPPGAPPAALPASSRSSAASTPTAGFVKPMNPAIARGLNSLPPRPNLNLPAPKNDSRSSPAPPPAPAATVDVEMGEVPSTDGFSGINDAADERVSAAVDEMLEAAAEEFGGYEKEEGEEDEEEGAFVGEDEPALKKRRE
ncbi:lariat debranching enzyme, C-terminal domain-containing protein [Obelidium mucronatum]|nr:lariat debranching enzyme, C-terminal domain-containing protein [Obelidium mucronatum]